GTGAGGDERRRKSPGRQIPGHEWRLDGAGGCCEEQLAQRADEFQSMDAHGGRLTGAPDCLLECRESVAGAGKRSPQRGRRSRVDGCRQTADCRATDDGELDAVPAGRTGGNRIELGTSEDVPPPCAAVLGTSRG